jgi:hypothetical protein
MAFMTTALELNSRGPGKQVEYITPEHSLSRPCGIRTNTVRQGDLLIPDRFSFTLFRGCEDSDGEILSKLITFHGELRTLRATSSADVSYVKALLRDLVASDNLDRLWSGRNLIADS